MSFVFEKRPYGPDSGPEVVQAIRERVSVLREGVVEIRDIPFGTAWSLGVMENELQRLTVGWPSIRVLVDLTGASPPSAELREALGSFSARESRIEATALYIGKSRIFLAFAKLALVMFRRHMRADAFSDKDAARAYLERDAGR